MNVTEFLNEHRTVIQGFKGWKYYDNCPRIVCGDGLTLSVQASRMHYCSPRLDDLESYESVEIGYPSAVIEEFLPFAEDEECPTSTVYAQVPIELVDTVITKHGGIAE